jgi:hypothetical protein
VLANGNILTDKWDVVFTTNFAGYVHVGPGRLDSNGCQGVTVEHDMGIEWLFELGDLDVANSRVRCWLTDFALNTPPTLVIDGMMCLRTTRSIGGQIANGGIYKKHYNMVWGGDSKKPLSRTQHKVIDHLYIRGANPV